MPLSELLSDLGAHIGLANVALDANGTCGLQFDDDVIVTLESNPAVPGELLIHAALSTTPVEDRTPMYLQMLLANHRRKQTQGAVFSLDESSGDIVLWTSFDGDNGDVELLAQTLATFVSSMRDWSARLDQAHSSSSDEPVPPGAGMIRV